MVELNSSGNVLAASTFGPTGLLARYTNTASTCYTFDAQGNVCQKYTTSGLTTFTLQSTSVFDAYGSKLSTETQVDPWGYEAQYGYFTDVETGLALCTHRYYDPSQGRFINRDPIGYEGGINVYGYVGNGPVVGVDPSGYLPSLDDLGNFFGNVWNLGRKAFSKTIAIGTGAVLYEDFLIIKNDLETKQNVDWMVRQHPVSDDSAEWQAYENILNSTGLQAATAAASDATNTLYGSPTRGLPS